MSSTDPPISREYRRFVRSVDALDDPVGVALAIDRELDPTVNPAKVRTHVEAMGAELAQRTNALPSPGQRVAVLGRFMGREHGYRGNADDYGDPGNAFIGRVIRTRRGLPITLSILYLGVARVAGIPVVGVGLPGHFVVGHLARTPHLFLDPFRAGQNLPREECDRIVRAVTGGATVTAEPFLKPVSSRSLMTRMLNNLQMAYWQRREYVRALHVARMLCTLNRTSLDALRGRAYVYDRMGRTADALVDYEAYLRRSATGPEAEQVRRRVTYLRSRAGRRRPRD